MIEHIRRFVESNDELIKNSFTRLFGSDHFRVQIAGLPGEERDDAIAFAYLDTLKAAGDSNLEVWQLCSIRVSTGVSFTFHT